MPSPHTLYVRLALWHALLSLDLSLLVYEHLTGLAFWLGLVPFPLSLQVSLNDSVFDPYPNMFWLVFIVTVGVGLQDRPSEAPKVGHWKSDYKLFNNPSFTEAISAVSTLVFTYAGTPAFFNIVAEMRQPLHYTRSLAICQITVTAVYIIVGTIVYYYCGSYVASPALGSAGVTVKKISYGIALPGLIVSCVLFIHV